MRKISPGPRMLLRILRLSFRRDHGSTILLFALIIARAATIPLSAISIALLVNSSHTTAVLAITGAAALTGVAYGLQFVISRAVLNLQEDMSHKVELVLQEELMRAVAAPPTLAPFSDPEYLDSLDALRRNMYPLANYLWRTTETLLSLAGLGLSVWLLMDVNPLLALLAIFSIAPLIGANLGQRILRASNIRVAPKLRLEKAVHQLATDAAAAKELLIAGSGPALDRRASALWREVSVMRMRARAAAGLVGLIGWILFAAALVSSLLLVSRQAMQGALPLGSVALILTLSTRLKNQISETLYGLANVGQASELIERFETIRAYPAPPPPPPKVNAEGGLRFEHASFKYPHQASVALQDVSIDIPPGSTVSLVGLNGAGKSTFIDLALGLDEPTEGRVVRGSGSVRSAAFQQFLKPRFTVREAVGLGEPSEMHNELLVSSAVERAQATSAVGRLEDGLDTKLGLDFGGVELSQGQWQRIALARSMMNASPAVLAFDEPTSAMDPQAEHDLFRLLMHQTRELGRRHGTITFFVSHRFTSADLSDLVVVLADGKIVEIGAHDALIAAGGLYADLFELQRAGYAR